MYPKNVINKKDRASNPNNKKLQKGLAGNQNTTGLGRAASGKKTLSCPEGIAR